MKLDEVLLSAHRSLQEFSEGNEEWLNAAREAIRPWEQQKELLLCAVAKALKDMYERGENGDLPVCNQVQKPARRRRGRAPVGTQEPEAPKRRRRR